MTTLFAPVLPTLSSSDGLGEMGESASNEMHDEAAARSQQIADSLSRLEGRSSAVAAENAVKPVDVEVDEGKDGDALSARSQTALQRASLFLAPTLDHQIYS